MGCKDTFTINSLLPVVKKILGGFVNIGLFLFVLCAIFLFWQNLKHRSRWFRFGDESDIL